MLRWFKNVSSWLVDCFKFHKNSNELNLKYVDKKYLSYSNTAKFDVLLGQDLINSCVEEWLDENWVMLSCIPIKNTTNYFDNEKLFLFVAVGYLESGNIIEAKKIMELMINSGVNKKNIAKLLLSGIYNHLGHIKILEKKDADALTFFKKSISIGLGESNLEIFAKRKKEKIKKELEEKILNLFEMYNPQNYYLPFGYFSRQSYTHYDDTNAKDEWQLEVYLYAYAIMKRHNLRSIIDFGCGSGFKLITYFSDFLTIGYELVKNINFLQKKYPDRLWKESTFDMELDSADLIICSDVIEHLVDPDDLLKLFRRSNIKHIIFSTPDSKLVYHDLYKERIFGPPKNHAHVREWDFNGFRKYIASYFDVIDHKIVNPEQGTQLVYCLNHF